MIMQSERNAEGTKVRWIKVNDSEGTKEHLSSIAEGGEPHL